VFKHLKSCSKPNLFCFPFWGQKNPSAEIHFHSASQIRVSGARILTTSHRLSTGFSASLAHREGRTIYQDQNIMQEFFLLFLGASKHRRTTA
jgi:hypothetical protein